MCIVAISITQHRMTSFIFRRIENKQVISILINHTISSIGIIEVQSTVITSSKFLFLNINIALQDIHTYPIYS